MPASAYPLAWVAPYLPVALLAGVPAAPACTPRPRPDRGRGGAAGSHRAARRRLRRDFWRFAGPRAVATVAQLALQRVDVLLVAALGGLGAAALYAVAGRFVVLGQLANQGISQAVQPRLAETLAIGDRAGARALYQTATGWLVLISWPLYLTVLTFAPLYLGLFGDAYRGRRTGGDRAGRRDAAGDRAAAWSTWCWRWAGVPPGTWLNVLSPSPSRSAWTCC